jgi:hypothetical protein
MGIDFKDFLFTHTEEKPNFDFDFSTLATDGRFSITQEKWKELTSKYKDSEIEQIISEAIDALQLEYPYKEISLEAARKDFLVLKQYQIQHLLKEGAVHSRTNRKDLPNFFLTADKIGKSACNYFQYKNRIRTYSSRHASCYDKWYKAALRSSWIRAAIQTGHRRGFLDSNLIRQAVESKFLSSQFPPTVAKFMYQKFNAKKVLDFSSGWGDRLCGFYASAAEEYVGIDPNPAVHEGYKEQVEFYETFGIQKKTTFIKAPAEETDLSKYKEYFDMVFTSPPYFSLERYSQDISQSWVRYKTPESWMENFMFATLDKIIPTMTVGGHLCINIYDVLLSKEIPLCDPILAYLKDKLEYVGCVPFYVTTRSEGRGIGTPVEPIWIWRKTQDQVKPDIQYVD